VATDECDDCVMLTVVRHVGLWLAVRVRGRGDRRLCDVDSCAVYHTSELMTSGQPVKVPLHGNSLTKIFSYADSFMPALSKYVSGDGVRPDAHVHLLCGQAVSVDKMDNRLLVRVSVRLERAVNDLDAADTAVST